MLDLRCPKAQSKARVARAPSPAWAWAAGSSKDQKQSKIKSKSKTTRARAPAPHGPFTRDCLYNRELGGIPCGGHRVAIARTLKIVVTRAAMAAVGVALAGFISA